MKESLDVPITQIHRATSMGAVRLVVRDETRMSSFYQQAIGLELSGSSGTVMLLTSSGRVLVELDAQPDAPSRSRNSTGLYHLAILLPDRPALARAIERVLSAGWSFTGAADHLVSEAFYLNDPEGNGIELYRDRPRDEWSFVHGELQMASLPVDADDVMAELPPGPLPERADGARMGHVHLQVADIPSAEAFYADVLGFDVVVRGYPGALFVSAGGYHHHIGLNTWNSYGVAPGPNGAMGLGRFEILVPDDTEVCTIKERLLSNDVPFEGTSEGLNLQDPSGNQLLIRSSTVQA